MEWSGWALVMFDDETYDTGLHMQPSPRHPPHLLQIPTIKTTTKRHIPQSENTKTSWFIARVDAEEYLGLTRKNKDVMWSE